MSRNLLKNGSFEADWSEEKSHRCLVVSENGTLVEREVGNIFTPPGWVTWFRHNPGTWDQPEVRDAWKQHDPHRVHSGQKAILLFTFYRKHDAGFLQQVKVGAGTRVRFTAWAHAWSNHAGAPDKFPHPDDGRWSEGPGYEPGFLLEGQAPNDEWRNFTFYVGIDPTGGTNPLADTVIWGQGAHIYNAHAQVPAVEATAQADTITVFMRSRTMWAFKHNDAYWDDAELTASGVEKPEVRLSCRPEKPRAGEQVTIEARSQAALTGVNLRIAQPSGGELARGNVVVGRDGEWYTWTYTAGPVSEAGTHTVVFSAAGEISVTGTFEGVPAEKPPRGRPRVQYERTYVLLPPDADAAWALAVVDGTWNRFRYTIGGSADDAGIGDLDVRRVIAINPQHWPSDLQAFFEQYYPGVQYTAIEASTPEELRQKLTRL